MRTLLGAEMTPTLSGMWGLLMLFLLYSAPVTWFKWGLQSLLGTSGPLLYGRQEIIKYPMHWGFPNCSEKEDGTQERGDCHCEPDIALGQRKKGKWWLQMHLAAVLGTQPMPATMVLCVPSRRKGTVYVNWKGWFTEFGSTLGPEPQAGTCCLSES